MRKNSRQTLVIICFCLPRSEWIEISRWSYDASFPSEGEDIRSHGLREGVLLAYMRYGENWLDHPEVKIDEGRQGQAPPLPKEAREQAGEETFARAGRRVLRKRAKKFLGWRDDVLSQKDIEAVHKMRVASRRLRSTLDAYETACKPGRFKKVYRQTKKAADLLGAARDTDTMIQQGEGWLE